MHKTLIHDESPLLHKVTQWPIEPPRRVNKVKTSPLRSEYRYVFREIHVLVFVYLYGAGEPITKATGVLCSMNSLDPIQACHLEISSTPSHVFLMSKEIF